jgi:transglutaminase-like putative cysteine protease
MPSRYCPSDEFQTFVAAEFGHLEGGARIAAMRDWIERAFSYVPGVSNAQTTALDSFVQRQGICRDYAHVLVTLARASTIPARFASVYAPDVTPQDFHAVAEVYLDGTWHLVDATGMAPADTIARIGVGADAADVAFLSAFGQAGFVAQTVSVRAE